MRLIDNMVSVAKTGKTLAVIEQEELSRNREKMEDYDKFQLRMENEQKYDMVKLEQHLTRIKGFLEKKDYIAVNKYLRLISSELTYSITLNYLNNPDSGPEVSDTSMSFFDNVRKEISKIHPKVKLQCYMYNVYEKIDYLEKLGTKLLPSPEPTFKVNERPMILNTWNTERLVQKFSEITPTNLFQPDDYFISYYYYPIDLIELNSLNHGHLSALLDTSNEHTSKIHQIYDISELYEYVYFDGSYIRLKEDSSAIKKARTSRQKMYGLFFEVGRLLLEHDDYFPKNLVECIN